MQKWKKKLADIAMQVDDIADREILRLRKRLGSTDPMHVVPYRTYGTPGNVYVRGRVLEDKKIAVNEGDRLFTNLLNMYKRFETDEVPGAKVILQLPGEQRETISDKEGYFVFNFSPARPIITDELYLSFPLQLQDSSPANTDNVFAEMMIPPADAEYGIISDIDDTIIRSNATSLMAMGKTVLLGTARTRLPFPGVSAFYKALQLGRNGKRNNPFFYVSSSPWNLYDLLTDFMDHNEIPPGPLLLRDFGLQSESFMSGDYMSHKFKEIARILDTYPHLNFVLAGDSGEQDPPIYLEVVKQYPGRITCIYIRDVIGGEKKATAESIAVELKKLGVEMLLTEHSVKAAEHAASTGLIYRDEIPAIVKDKKEDTGQLPGKEETAVSSGNTEDEPRKEK
jgi:phosphatidate phosphatase APP1